MPKTGRTRIDYMPGQVAVEALRIAQELHPRDNTQVLIDRLVITGLAALGWKLPSLYARNRDRWTLPDGLRQFNREEGRFIDSKIGTVPGTDQQSAKKCGRESGPP